MSDTPLTDDAEEWMRGSWFVPSDVASQLERENAALLALLARAADALRGMVGLVQLVSDRRYPDFPVDNHRVIECMSASKAIDDELALRHPKNC